MANSTGHGATIAFGTQSFTASYREIGGYTQEREAIDTSHLGTTGHRTTIPGDLATAGSFDITFLYDPEGGLPSVTAVAETITVTFPSTTAGADSTVAASGFLTSVGSPTLATDQLMEATCTVQWADGPTLTVEPAS